MDELRKLKTNADVANSAYWDEAAIFLREIGERADATYLSGGTALVSLKTEGSHKVRKIFKNFGYSIGYGDKHYAYGKNFTKVRESIKGNMPVFIYGYPVINRVVHYTKGHCWVLDGIKVDVKITYYKTYKFDEYGNYNSYYEHEAVLFRAEYVHANMGWSNPELHNAWVRSEVYVFDNDTYEELYFIAGIKPNK